MPIYVVMIPSATPGVAVSSPPYSSLEDALSGAKYMLSNGAALAWIVDEKGRIALPAEQVKSRLDALDGSQRSPFQTKGFDKAGLRPVWLVQA